MIEAFKTLNFKELLTQNEFMMKNLFFDIFRALLLGLRSPPPTFLIDLILEYIEICFSIAKNEDIDQLLRITLQFIKHIDNVPQNASFFERILTQIIQASPKLIKMIEEDTTDFYLEIIEELVIVGLSPQVLDYPSYLVELYSTLSKNEQNGIPIEVAFRLKSSIFSIYTTLLLLALEKGVYKLSDFEFCVRSILNEIFGNNDKTTVKHFMRIKTQCMSLLNRFLLLDSDAILALISKGLVSSLSVGNFPPNVSFEHDVYQLG